MTEYQAERTLNGDYEHIDYYMFKAVGYNRLMSWKAGDGRISVGTRELTQQKVGENTVNDILEKGRNVLSVSSPMRRPWDEHNQTSKTKSSPSLRATYIDMACVNPWPSPCLIRLACTPSYRRSPMNSRILSKFAHLDTMAFPSSMLLCKCFRTCRGATAAVTQAFRSSSLGMLCAARYMAASRRS